MKLRAEEKVLTYPTCVGSLVVVVVSVTVTISIAISISISAAMTTWYTFLKTGIGFYKFACRNFEYLYESNAMNGEKEKKQENE